MLRVKLGREVRLGSVHDAFVSLVVGVDKELLFVFGKGGEGGRVRVRVRVRGFMIGAARGVRG